MEEFVIKAAQNNADWCDIVCSAHGVPGEFLEYIWLNKQEVPTLLYPNVVTIKPISNKDYNALVKTVQSIPLKNYAIKDSFNELLADKMSCKVLFDAEWILLNHGDLVESNISGIWTVVRDEQELEKWEYAWNNNQPSDKRIFLSNILPVKNVFFLAKYNNEQIVGGGIVNISRDVVGLSNIFTQEVVNSNIYSELTIFIKENISTLSIVDYERDKELALAHKAGFKTIGKLKVLLKI